MVRLWLFAVASLACICFTDAARGAIRESVQFGNVDSRGADGSASNVVVQTTLSGGYQLGVITLRAQLIALDSTTWAADAHIVITAPGGQTLTVQPFPGQGTFGSAKLYIRSTLLQDVGNPAGVWTFRCYEQFVDNPGGSDARHVAFTVEWTDDAPTPPSAQGLGVFAGAREAFAEFPSYGSNDVEWVRFELAQDVSAADGWLDIDLIGSSFGAGGSLSTNTDIALYDELGFLIATDDNSGDGLTSQLSFGSGARPANGNGLAFDGQNGDLTAGVYYLAVAGADLVAREPLWNVGSTSTASGSIRVNIRASIAVPPPCVGDINGDGLTNAADFTTMAGNYGSGPGYPLWYGDLNDDGYINASDFVILAGDYGCDSSQ